MIRFSGCLFAFDTSREGAYSGQRAYFISLTNNHMFKTKLKYLLKKEQEQKHVYKVAFASN